MQYHEYGDRGKKTLMVMHGMICDWQKFRELFMPLEQDFRVIYPAMNGCYDGAPDFRKRNTAEAKPGVSGGRRLRTTGALWMKLPISAVRRTG